MLHGLKDRTIPVGSPPLALGNEVPERAPELLELPDLSFHITDLPDRAVPDTGTARIGSRTQCHEFGNLAQ
jgi:hypothetical protein